MGAAFYCSETKDCDYPFNWPSARYDLIDGVTCPKCGKRQPQRMSIEEWIANIDDRLRAVQMV